MRCAAFRLSRTVQLCFFAAIHFAPRLSVCRTESARSPICLLCLVMLCYNKVEHSEISPSENRVLESKKVANCKKWSIGTRKSSLWRNCIYTDLERSDVECHCKDFVELVSQRCNIYLHRRGIDLLIMRFFNE